MKTIYAILFQVGNLEDWGWEILKYTDSLFTAKKYKIRGCRIEEIIVTQEDYDLLIC